MSTAMIQGYIVVYVRCESGNHWGVHVPDLPGCVATGKTIDECRERMAFSLPLHIQAMREDGDFIPAPSAISEIMLV